LIKSVSQKQFIVGYSDIQLFREIFKRIAGMTPVDYRNKFNKVVKA